MKKINRPYLPGPNGYLHYDEKLPVSYGFLYPNLLVNEVHIGLSREALFMAGGNPYWHFKQMGRN